MRVVGHSARAARRAVAIAAGAGACALASQSLPAALAAKTAVTVTTPLVTVEAPAVPHAHHAERAAKAEAAPPPPAPAAPAPAPPEATAAGHKHHGQGDGAPSAAQPGSPGVSAGGSHHGEAEAAPAHSRRRASGRGSSEASGAGAAEGIGAAVDSTGKAVTQSVEALARKKKTGGGGEKGGGRKRKEREREKEGSPPGETEGSKGQGGGTSGTKGKPVDVNAGSATTALAATAAPATATPVAGVTAATAAPATPSVTPAQGLAAGGALTNHAGRAHRHARRKTPAHRGAAPATLGAPATALASTTLASGSGSSGGGAHPRSGLGGSYARSTEPAIVHTITRIVDVVPGPVRILIAALAALALALGLRSLLSGVRTRRLERQRGELLEDVGLLQAALLPDPPARLGPVGTSVAYRPADGPGAGGDFYDVFALDAGRLAVIVGDVSGHGREALPHTALLRYTVRAYLEAGLEPSEALQTAGAVLERQLGGSFATVLAAIYDPRERKLTYAAAGHPPPLVLSEPDASGAIGEIVPVTVCSAPPLGAGMRTGTRQTVVAIPGPARLCFHTDGVTEARVGEELFGEGRLTRSLASLPADTSASELLARVAEQSSARPDDMAACLLHVHGGAGAPAIVGERLELDGDAIGAGRARRFLEACGVTRADATASIERARRELAHATTVVVELSYEGGAPVVAVRGEQVVRAAALNAARAVGASR